MTITKHQNKIYNINKSENITSKMRPKIGNHKINNLNINFNNVIFNAPLSHINQNINNYINNTNENLSCKILTPTNNNNFNSTFSNNKNNNSQLANNNTVKEPLNEKINYITNLKNFCNFSRNKFNIYGKSFSQNDDNYSLIKNNKYSTNNGKIGYDKNKNTNNTYSCLYTNEKNDIFKKKKIELIIPKPNNNKKISLKNGKKSSYKSQKSKKKIEGRNKKFENGMKNFGMTENSKDMNGNESFKTRDDIRNINNSTKIFLSPNSTGRIATIQPINVNRNTNLLSKKVVKTKQRIKMK